MYHAKRIVIDENTMKTYLKEIWFKESIYKTTKNTLLVMDCVISHFSIEISNIYEKYDSKFMLILPGLTYVLQPLDTYVNKSFKANVRSEYHNRLLKNKNY